jgi:hypothetical protein
MSNAILRRRLSAGLALVAMATAAVSHADVRIAHNDMDGDGRSDIVWANSATGELVYWRSGVAAARREINVARPSGFSLADYVPRFTGHFNFQGRFSIVAQHRTTGELRDLGYDFTTRDGTYIATTDPVPLGPPADLGKVQGLSADFDAQGIHVPIFHDLGSGIVHRGMNWWGLVFFEPVRTIRDRNWRMVAAGDFNGDRAADLFWRHGVTGENVIWPGGMPTRRYVTDRVADIRWAVAGVGDFNGDGRFDLLWRNGTTGQNVLWQEGSRASRKVIASFPIAWQVAAIGDFNGDARSDILWRNTATGHNTIWLSGDTTTRRPVRALHPKSPWRIVR